MPTSKADPKTVTEFDLYCSNKSIEGRTRLRRVRDLILASVSVCEARMHFHLVLGAGVVAKLHLDAREQPNLTFVVGSELHDPRVC